MQAMVLCKGPTIRKGREWFQYRSVPNQCLELHVTFDRLAVLMRLARRPFDIQKQPVILLLVFQAPGIVRLPCKNALSGSLFIGDTVS